MNPLLNTLRWRITCSLALGLFLAWALSEAAFLFLKDSSDRAPQQIELVVPKGTAERIAAGQPVPSIPEMVFVAGDTLVVKNEDVASHQLGPLWVPAGATASLTMDQPNRYAYTCSFQSSRYLGLDVRSRVTMQTRLIAITLAGPPMAALGVLYSLVIWPLKPRAAQLETAPIEQPAETSSTDPGQTPVVGNE